MPFETNQKTLDSGVTALILSGSMTMGAKLQRFEWMIEELVKDHQTRIVVDMSGISYLDSSAVGVLVGCHGIVKHAGGQFRIAGLNDRVAKIVKLAGVESILVIDPTSDAAASVMGAKA